ncbi:MAG: maleylpyruvate isomerase N-terminal domain-containing protein [Nocardioides sp.]
MPLTFAGTLDRSALVRASEALTSLVGDPRVEEAWDRGSAVPGFTVGGMVRHLVSQPECAVEFLRIQPVPPHAEVVSLAGLYHRTDWFHAPVEAPENTSIVEDFNAMAAGRQEHSAAILRESVAGLPGAIADAGPTTYVPWQDCLLATDDFLVVRLMEVVVHADDLAASIGADVPEFDDEALYPVLALLAVLGAGRHGQAGVVRALARAERTEGSISAFG